MANNSGGTSGIRITENDLKDPSLSRLNRRLDLMESQTAEAKTTAATALRSTALISTATPTPTPIPVPSYTPAGDVTLGTPKISYQQNGMVHITIPFTVPSPLDTWDHVWAYLQAPDDAVTLSKAIVTTGVPSGNKGFFIGPAGSASNIVPNSSPIPFGPFRASEPVLVIDYPAPSVTQTWRVYAPSGSTEIENKLVSVNDGGTPTPNVSFTVNPIGAGVSGEEYAPTAAAFTMAAGWPRYSHQADGSWLWGFSIQWSNKTADPRYALLGGYDVIVQYPDGHMETQASPAKGNLGGVETSDMWPVPSTNTTFILWLVSWSTANGFKQTNSIVAGVTPSLAFTIGPQTAGPGAEYAPNVPNYSAFITGWHVNAAGQYTCQITFNFDVPMDVTWGGVVIHMIRADGTDYTLSGVTKQSPFVYDLFSYPQANEATTVYWLSQDTTGHENTYVPGTTPSQALTLVPIPYGNAGTEYTSLATATSATIQYSTTVDGVEVWRVRIVWTKPSSDATFGGITPTIVWQSDGRVVPLGDVSDPSATYYSSWFQMGASDVAKVYLVSFDVNNKANTLVAGVTPLVINTTIAPQTSGKVNGGRIDSATLAHNLAVNSGLLGVAPPGLLTDLTGAYALGTTNISDNAVTTPKLIAGAVTTPKLQTTEITIGWGGTSMPVRFRMYGNTGLPVAWIGDDTANSGKVGGWFKSLWAGGTGPAGAPFNVENGLLSIVMDSTNAGATPFQLTYNGIVTSITNSAVLGYQAGLTMVDTPGNHGTIFVGASSGGAQFGINDSGGSRVSLSYAWGGSSSLSISSPWGYVASLYAGSSGTILRLEGYLSSPFLIDATLKQFQFPSGWTASVGGFMTQSVTIGYLKAGGATGSLTFMNGWLVASS